MTVEILDVWAYGPRQSFRYCELAKGQKRPINNNWQTDTKSFEEVWNAYETKQANIGLVLGSTSGVMDIDCDSHEAVIVLVGEQRVLHPGRLATSEQEQ